MDYKSKYPLGETIKVGPIDCQAYIQSIKFSYISIEPRYEIIYRDDNEKVWSAWYCESELASIK